ncbi:RNA polymerase sigma factor [Streptomyces sp. NPDC048172]|uniref:RNA polymerase sigma factor n=1 Tax=Streptomyces sp. NPDC048172 TaxID=3365505 RepID=UPI0037127D42
MATWGRDGTPARPGAWLTTTARHRATDRLRREPTGAAKLRQLAVLERDPAEPPAEEIPDERLRLIFTCCQPALPFPARVALTLRTLAGLSTGEIAKAFLTAEPEARGLLALMLLLEARRAHRTDDGVLVTLENQDRSRWERALIAEGTATLDEALTMRRAGPYHVQAAIAACHTTAPDAADTDWPQIAALYAELTRLAPSPVVDLNRAVAIAMADGIPAGTAAPPRPRRPTRRRCDWRRPRRNAAI